MHPHHLTDVTDAPPALKRVLPCNLQSQLHSPRRSCALTAQAASWDTHTAVASTTVHHTSPYRSAMNMRRKMVSETTKKTQAHASHPTHPRLRKRHNPRVKCRSRISYTYLDTALRRPSTNASTSPDRRHQRTHHTHTRVSICNVNSPALAALTP